MACKEGKSATFEAGEPTIPDMEADAPDEEPEEETEIEAHPKKRGRRAFRTAQQVRSSQALRQQNWRISNGLTMQARPHVTSKHKAVLSTVTQATLSIKQNIQQGAADVCAAVSQELSAPKCSINFCDLAVSSTTWNSPDPTYRIRPLIPAPYAHQLRLFNKASGTQQSFRYSTKLPLFTKASVIQQSFCYSTTLPLLNKASVIQQSFRCSKRSPPD